MATVADCLRKGAASLKNAGIDNAAFEARLLLSETMGVPAPSLIAYPERSVPDPDAFGRVIERRARREPVAQIVGRREFWGLPFEVTADTLDPRPDSETVVAAVLEAQSNRGRALQILDLGTGTGCLLLSLLSELPGATGLGVDRSRAALTVARRNAERLGLAERARFLESDWTGAVAGQFDVVVANPPYIPSADIEKLQPEVASYEPRRALDGGPDGLEAYRSLLSDIDRVMKPGAIVALEVGDGQAAAVGALLDGRDLEPGEYQKDLSGRVRCVLAKRRIQATKQKKSLEYRG